jgi:HTH-type transcriptional regulator/antitoxin HigA
MSLAFDRKLYGKLLAEYQPQVVTSEAEYEVMLANAERLIGCKIVPKKKQLCYKFW